MTDRRSRPGRQPAGHSTVTDLARLRGWSTSWPLRVASSQANTCSAHDRDQRLEQRRHLRQGDDHVRVRRHLVALLGQHDRPRPAGADLLDVGDHLVVRQVPTLRGHHDEDRQLVLDQRDRTVLELRRRRSPRRGCGELLRLQGLPPAPPGARRADRGTAPTVVGEVGGRADTPSRSASCRSMAAGISPARRSARRSRRRTSFPDLGQIEAEQVAGHQLGQEALGRGHPDLPGRRGCR